MICYKTLYQQYVDRYRELREAGLPKQEAIIKAHEILDEF